MARERAKLLRPPSPPTRVRDTMKGVGKFGEIMAREARADYAASLDKAARIVRAGGKVEAKLDLILSDLVKNFPRYTWAGIYAVEGDELVLRAWKGPQPTQHVRVPLSQGICGLAARTDETVVVDDVRGDDRYLECFPSTRSEIVVPIRKDGEVVGEIDIDSDAIAAFTEEDRAFLERLSAEMAPLL
jgi:GAF domain-containing protein